MDSVECIICSMRRMKKSARTEKKNCVNEQVIAQNILKPNETICIATLLVKIFCSVTLRANKSQTSIGSQMISAPTISHFDSALVSLLVRKFMPWIRA